MLVLKLLGPGGLRGVRAETLLRAGLNAERLAACGHGIVAVTQHVMGTVQELAQLGFRV